MRLFGRTVSRARRRPGTKPPDYARARLASKSHVKTIALAGRVWRCVAGPTHAGSALPLSAAPTSTRAHAACCRVVAGTQGLSSTASSTRQGPSPLPQQCALYSSPCWPWPLRRRPRTPATAGPRPRSSGRFPRLAPLAPAPRACRRAAATSRSRWRRPQGQAWRR